MKQNIEIRDCERNEKEQNPKLKEGFFQALSEWPPPSVPRFGQLVQFFSDGKQPRFESQLRTKKSICAICNILNTSNLKTVSSSSYLRFGRNRLNLLTKDGLLENVPKIWAILERNLFLFTGNIQTSGFSSKLRAAHCRRNLFRELDAHFNHLAIGLQKNISRSTGCLKPCFYKKYSLRGHKQLTAFK